MVVVVIVGGGGVRAGCGVGDGGGTGQTPNTGQATRTSHHQATAIVQFAFRVNRVASNPIKHNSLFKSKVVLRTCTCSQFPSFFCIQHHSRTDTSISYRFDDQS